MPENSIIEEPIGRRERRKLEVKGRIADSARELLSNKDLEEVTVDEICETADVAKKTFYNHFPSKQDLIESISQELLIETSVRNYEMAIEKFSNTRERLEYFLFQQGINLSDAETLKRNLVKHAMLDLSVNSKRSQEKLESNITLFEKLINAGKELDDVTDKYSSRFLAEMVAGHLNTSAIHWIHYPDYPQNQRFQELKSLILDTVLK